MQIAVVGIQGSGKSHFVSKEIIPKNFSKGRRILTNIKGFNVEELRKYCIETLQAKPEDLGEVVVLRDKDIVLQPKIKDMNELYQLDPDDPKNFEKLKSFYPYILEDDNHNEVVIDKHSVVKSGDVVVIDEAGRFYKKVSEYDMEYFRMHRHMTDKNGDATELCFMMQTKRMVKGEFFDLMAIVYKCKKLGALGFSNRYSLQIFDGATMRRDTAIGMSVGKYDKKVFPIYSSYSGGKGNEKSLDTSASLLKQPKTIIILSLIIPVLWFSYHYITAFFHTKPKTEVKQSTSTAAPAPASTTAQPLTPQQQEFTSNSQSSQFKIVGVIDLPTKRMVLVQDNNMTMRVVSPQVCVGSGLSMICKIDNKEVSYYSQIKTNNNSYNIGGYNNENKHQINNNNNVPNR
jgi:zona occludens toxin